MAIIKILITDHCVKECARSGTNETCEPCQKYYVQPNLISSFDSDRDRTCFRPKDKEECPEAGR